MRIIMFCPICKSEMIIEDKEVDKDGKFTNITYLCSRCGHRSVEVVRNGKNK